jgi:hypothetical protein
MNPFEYAIAMWSILMGLAVADLILSANRLFRHPGGVRWDGRIVAAASLVMLELIRIWFAQWSLANSPSAVSFPAFIAMCVHVGLLVFLAAAALPDDANETDLSVYFDRNRRYFWGLFAACQAVYFSLWLAFFKGGISTVGDAAVVDWVRMIAPLAVYVALVFIRRRWLDYLGPLAIAIFYLWLYRDQVIG